MKIHTFSYENKIIYYFYLGGQKSFFLSPRGLMEEKFGKRWFNGLLSTGYFSSF